MKSTTHRALGRLTRNSRLTMSSGHGALGIADRGDGLLAPPHTCPAHGAHQPFHRALGDHYAFAPQLVPDLARAVETKAGVMDTLDLCSHLVVALGTSRSPAGIGKTGNMLVVGGRGDRLGFGAFPRKARRLRFTADRLDTQVLAMGVDERRYQLPWRSRSAIAKYADALRRISLARRSSLTSRSSNLRRSRSLVTCAASPAHRLASSRHQRRSVSVVQPTFPAVEVIAAHSDG